MGLRGPKQSNNATKLLQGAGKYRLADPPKASGTPKKPAGLSDIAQKFWATYVPKLVAMGLATEVDAPQLEKLAFLFGEWQRTKALMIDAAFDYATIQAQRIRQANAQFGTDFDKLAVHFGLTPLARNSLTISDGNTEDDGPFSG